MTDISQEWLDSDDEWFEIDPLFIEELVDDMFAEFEDSESL